MLVDIKFIVNGYGGAHYRIETPEESDEQPFEGEGILVTLEEWEELLAIGDDNDVRHRARGY